LLGSEWPHDRREGLEVAQDLGNGVERRLEGLMAHDSLERTIAPGASWQIDWQMLQAIDHIPQEARHVGKNGYPLVELREIVMAPLQPPWPIAQRKQLQSREERIQGDGWQRRRKHAERGLF
jgi:hypothetical protein